MLKNIWDFFQNEILGMKWLNRLIGSGLETVGLDTGSRIGGSILFFYLRYDQDHGTAGLPDIADFLYSKLFSTGAD